MNPWLLAAPIAAGLIAFTLVIWLMYVGRQTLGVLLRTIETRGWVAIGLFVLTAMIFLMIRETPNLTANQGFMFLAQAVIVSGLIGGVVAFLYGASKPDPAKPPAPDPLAPPAP